MVERFIGWLKHPFQAEGSAANWFWFLGLLIVILWMWTTILRQIRKVAD